MTNIINIELTLNEKDDVIGVKIGEKDGVLGVDFDVRPLWEFEKILGEFPISTRVTIIRKDNE